MADIVIMGLAPGTYPFNAMGVYEWQEEHSGGERPVYKLKDDDDCYLYYCDSIARSMVCFKRQRDHAWTQDGRSEVRYLRPVAT